MWREREKARGFAHDEIAIGTDVVGVGRQIEFGIVTHQLRYRDEFRNVPLRVKLESNGDVGRCRLAGIRMDM